MKTYTCKLCNREIRTSAIPDLIEKQELCAECFHIKMMALGDTLKKFAKQQVKEAKNE